MDCDYLLIAVDSQKKYAIRFLSLSHVIRESLKLHEPGPLLAQVYAEFLLASTVLGSRLDEQESILFKIKMAKGGLSINCEVSPRGSMRSAIFPRENRAPESLDLSGFLKIARLNSGNEVYESIVEMHGEGVQELIRKYLAASVQTCSLFFVNADITNLSDNYVLWIEKLPGTSVKEWESFQAKYSQADFFKKSFLGTADPDVIVGRLFDEPITILTVTSPKLTCLCSKEKVVDALKLLSAEDLADIFMQGQGVSTECDYCRKVWQVTDEDVKKIMNIKSTLH